ncbi:MAG: ribbon-helix-helix protein, CopG family [Candidatus Peribacteraceae bacterium]|nr:ribbon-helix-helix protein, CopG family [Candidatus Peribacteraceae bacterium]
MRSLVTISLPPSQLASLKKKAKKRKVSVSYYVRMVLEHENEIISEEQLLAYCKEAEQDYRKGRTYVLKDFKDLAGNL